MHEDISPLITTIIPTYRRPLLLKRAIKSVLTQTFKNLQICIYDNASGDETREVVEEFAKIDSRVKYFCHDTNIGSSKNFKYGLEKVNTPYFSFLADDDCLFPEFYQTGLEQLSLHSKAGLFVGNCINCTNRFNILNVGLTHQREGLYMPEDSVTTFIGRDLINWISIIFNREMIKEFTITDSIKIIDVDFFAKILYKVPLVVSKKYCAVFISSRDSCSSNLQIEDMWPVMRQIISEAEKTKAVSETIKNRTSLRVNNFMVEYLYKKALKSILLNDREKFNKTIEILERDFKEIERIKKLKIFKKIKVLSIIGPSLLFFRSCFLYLLSNRYYVHRKKLLGLIRNLK